MTKARKDPLQDGTWVAGSVTDGETEAWRGKTRSGSLQRQYPAAFLQIKGLSPSAYRYGRFCDCR